MKPRDRKVSRLVFAFAIILLTMSGCASTKGAYSPAIAPKEQAELQKFTAVVLDVQCDPGIALSPTDLSRIKSKIIANLKSERPGRFTEIDPATPGATTMDTCVKVNKYDKGNAFARAMLAGLGQMHIEAEVTSKNWETKDLIAKYSVSKTFAWGGIYGGTTTIEDIEDGFAKAVVASLLGEKEQK